MSSKDGAPSDEDHDQALAELEKVTDGKAKLEGVARLAEQAQPKGSTLDSAGVHTPVRTTAPAASHLYAAVLPGASRMLPLCCRYGARVGLTLPTLYVALSGCGGLHVLPQTALAQSGQAPVSAFSQSKCSRAYGVAEPMHGSSTGSHTRLQA